MTSSPARSELVTCWWLSRIRLARGLWLGPGLSGDGEQGLGGEKVNEVLDEIGVVGEYLGLGGDCLEGVEVEGLEVEVVYLEEEDGGESLRRSLLRGDVLVCCAGRRSRACEACNFCRIACHLLQFQLQFESVSILQIMIM